MLPALTKTWRFGPNLAVPSGANSVESNRYLWWALYNALCGQKPDNSGPIAWVDSDGVAAAAPAALFVPQSESNSVAVGNNDLVKRINSFADVVFGAFGGALTWSHLHNSALGIHIKMMFGSTATSANYSAGQASTEGQQSAFNMSFVGFGAAVGGVDGTTTVPPLTDAPANQSKFSKTDNASIETSQNDNWGGTAGVTTAHRLHVCVSSDGKAWRIFGFRNGRSCLFLNIEAPRDPVVIVGAPNRTWNGLDKPIVAWNMGTLGDDFASRVLRHAANFNTSQRIGMTFLAQAGNANLVKRAMMSFGVENVSGTNLGTTSYAEQNVGPSALTNEYGIAPVALWSIEPGQRGRAGLCHDLYHGQGPELGGPQEGDSYPLLPTPTFEFAHFGCYVHPWCKLPILTS